MEITGFIRIEFDSYTKKYELAVSHNGFQWFGNGTVGTAEQIISVANGFIQAGYKFHIDFPLLSDPNPEKKFTESTEFIAKKVLSAPNQKNVVGSSIPLDKNGKVASWLLERDGSWIHVWETIILLP